MGKGTFIISDLLTPEPEGFIADFTFRDNGPVVVPLKVPRKSRFVAQIEWSWSPVHSLDETYFLSTNRMKSHWILWGGYYDDNMSFKWEFEAHVNCRRKGIPAKTAAVYLLYYYWRQSLLPADIFDMFKISYLLNQEELFAIANRVWPRERI